MIIEVAIAVQYIYTSYAASSVAWKVGRFYYRLKKKKDFMHDIVGNVQDFYQQNSALSSARRVQEMKGHKHDIRKYLFWSSVSFLSEGLLNTAMCKQTSLYIIILAVHNHMHY